MQTDSMPPRKHRLSDAVADMVGRKSRVAADEDHVFRVMQRALALNHVERRGARQPDFESLTLSFFSPVGCGYRDARDTPVEQISANPASSRPSIVDASKINCSGASTKAPPVR